MNKGITNKELMERKANNKKTLTTMLINNPDGLTIKEIAIDLKVSGDTARNYIKEMIGDGLVTRRSVGGKMGVFLWSDTIKEEKEPEKPVVDEHHEGGKVIENVIPATSATQGDVVWISSRSGEGQFFRYLIMANWSRKATVIGIVAEGNPLLNLNDTRFVEIGVDPETGEGLYADLSNFCSRGYAQFGNKLMRVSAERLEDVKKRIAMYHNIKACPDDEKALIERLNKQNDKLRRNADNAIKECEKAKADCRDALAISQKAIDEKDKLEEKYLENMDKLKSLNNRLLQKTEEAKVQDEKYKVCFKEFHDLKEKYEALSEEHAKLKNVPVKDTSSDLAALEATVACQKDYISTLKELLFTALRKEV